MQTSILNITEEWLQSLQLILTKQEMEHYV